eukprot:20919-Heterococcus_DN1.PRE.1
MPAHEGHLQQVAAFRSKHAFMIHSATLRCTVVSCTVDYAYDQIRSCNMTMHVPTMALEVI